MKQATSTSLSATHVAASAVRLAGFTLVAFACAAAFLACNKADEIESMQRPANYLTIQSITPTPITPNAPPAPSGRAVDQLALVRPITEFKEGAAIEMMYNFDMALEHPPVYLIKSGETWKTYTDLAGETEIKIRPTDKESWSNFEAFFRYYPGREEHGWLIFTTIEEKRYYCDLLNASIHPESKSAGSSIGTDGALTLRMRHLSSLLTINKEDINLDGYADTNLKLIAVSGKIDGTSFTFTKDADEQGWSGIPNSGGVMGLKSLIFTLANDTHTDEKEITVTVKPSIKLEPNTHYPLKVDLAPRQTNVRINGRVVGNTTPVAKQTSTHNQS
jgi:hypothetical protein